MIFRSCAVALAIAVLSSCGSSVVGSCSPKTCVDGCCTLGTADAPSRCLREPLNSDHATCGTSGLACEDCTKRSLDAGTKCVNNACG